jgi:hypothetical protein
MQKNHMKGPSKGKKIGKDKKMYHRNQRKDEQEMVPIDVSHKKGTP